MEKQVAVYACLECGRLDLTACDCPCGARAQDVTGLDPERVRREVDAEVARWRALTQEQGEV